MSKEGLLSDGWIEKHSSSADKSSTALPSAILIAVNANEDRSGITIDNELNNLVEQIRALIAKKRPVSIHIAVLLNSYNSSASSTSAAAERGEKILQRHRDGGLQEQISNECKLPTEHVYILRQGDLENEEGRGGVGNRPNDAGAAMGNTNSSSVSGGAGNMSPALRGLTNNLMKSSALYYSQLAEHAEKKLTLWRNRYHTTNASFEVNTLVCTLRCGRYAFKSGIFRELEQCTGQATTVTGAGIGSTRHYEEAYRWVMELHQRVYRWRSYSKSSSLSNVPVTPGATSNNNSKEFSSPKVVESPGGGIGVELSLPVPPPQGTPGPKRGSLTPENLSFYSSLYHQSRTVASMLNVKLMLCQNSMKNLEGIWRRHRMAFLANYDNDTFFGPTWYRVLFFSEELKLYSSLSESLWRKDGKLDPRSLDSSYFSAAAPWGIFAELAEVTLKLGGEIKKMIDTEGWKDPDDGCRGEKRRFGGSDFCGGDREESLKLSFEAESTKKHKGELFQFLFFFFI